MEVARLLGAHAQFIQWRQKKASVLATVEHLFPPKHPLRAAVANCTLQADEASCRLCDRIGEEQFQRESRGLSCTQLFYGLGARADSLEMPPRALHAQWLRLEELDLILDLDRRARAFASSVRTLTDLPRKRAQIDSCEARFLASWGRALDTLLSVEVDMRGAFFMAAALRRAGLLPDVCRTILEFAVPWPQPVGDGQTRKRRRVVR